MTNSLIPACVGCRKIAILLNQYSCTILLMGYAYNGWSINVTFIVLMISNTQTKCANLLIMTVHISLYILILQLGPEILPYWGHIGQRFVMCSGYIYVRKLIRASQKKIFSVVRKTKFAFFEKKLYFLRR